ncbi:hypothetical protein K353_03540 [Kitasatospora sp. SolWspMP-SS2h]|uniref:hypothetical protein n=1 Tax=Kitasatospora sp. SolWspMP-SS2h TaxID=1305729 RepID=UPI000DB91977|nr:hypothetical protein [Kitasatospora sp. SolWspMP-SS2h]RAJ40052.1 hypothetical protein K353_03540 [Kitasatospora sp. SolWspMP-SS2h]
MSYLRTFLPWIIFAVVPSSQWQWAALAGLVVAAAVIVQQRLAGAGWDALIIETGSALYFAVLAAIAFADPHSGVRDYSAALSSAVLAVIAGGSLLIGKPFTLGIAKRTTPQEFWTLKPFIRVNVVITAVWTAAFAVTAVVLGVLAHGGHGHSTPSLIVQIAGFVVPMVFTIRYVALVRARAPRAQQG